MQHSPARASAVNVMSSPCEYLAFVLGSENYGIDIQSVQEIRSYEVPTQLANAPAFIKGVINLRGVIVPVIDLRLKFRVASPGYGPLTVVVILNLRGHVVGMVVDAVSEVIALASDQIRPMPGLSAGAGTGYLLGVGTVHDRMLMLLDIEKMMADIELSGLEQSVEA